MQAKPAMADFIAEAARFPHMPIELHQSAEVVDKPRTVNTPLRILNFEDSAEDAEPNEAMLSARWPQCEFRRADSREEFIAALEQSSFDLILSDFSLPGFSGMESLTLAHDKRPDLPFLFVSGTIGEDTAIKALKGFKPKFSG